MFWFLFNVYQICLVVISVENVHTESSSYIEERLLEKMVEMEFKMQKVIERLDNLEQQDVQRGEEMKHLVNISAHSLMVNSLETDGWKMVFLAIASNGQSVYDAWTTGKGTSSEKPLAMERSYSCHYRDRLITNWVNLGVKYVKFALYDRFQEVAYVIFNGSGSNMTNWFDRSRVISSSWPDLTSTSTYNSFSISGRAIPNDVERRFYISKLHNGCASDTGYVAVIYTVSTLAGCAWNNHVSHPQFLYSKINSADIWQRNLFGRADFMAIFIKT